MSFFSFFSQVIPCQTHFPSFTHCARPHQPNKLGARFLAHRLLNPDFGNLFLSFSPFRDPTPFCSTNQFPVPTLELVHFYHIQIHLNLSSPESHPSCFYTARILLNLLKTFLKRLLFLMQPRSLHT